MDNSFHSDNSICPINIISRVLSFLASFRSRQIQRPFPLKIVPCLYSAVLCALQIGRVRANADFENLEYVEQETDRLEQRRNPQEIIRGCLSEGRGCRRR